MLEESGCSLGKDATVAKCGHLTSHKGLDKLVIIEGAEALLELSHQLRSKEIGVGCINGFFEQSPLPVLIKVESHGLTEWRRLVSLRCHFGWCLLSMMIHLGAVDGIFEQGEAPLLDGSISFELPVAELKLARE